MRYQFEPYQHFVREYQLPLGQPWRSALETKDSVSGFLLTVRDSAGHLGFGDCAPMPALGCESLDQARTALNDCWISWKNHHASTPAANFAIESALLDLAAKQNAIPLAKLLHPNASSQIRVNGFCPKLDASAVVALKDQGFDIIKLKLGIGNPADELSVIQEICSELTSAKLRLDANCAWTLDDAQFMLKGLCGLPIDALEEPLASPSLNLLEFLQQNTNIRIALDESIRKLGVEQALAAKISRLVIKPPLFGGIRKCLDFAQSAVDAGKQVVITSMLESAAGLHSLAHVASAVDAICPGMAHGLATSSLLAQNLGQSPTIEHGILRLSDQPGSGFSPYE